jgi:hypothetical protein
MAGQMWRAQPAEARGNDPENRGPIARLNRASVASGQRRQRQFSRRFGGGPQHPHQDVIAFDEVVAEHPDNVATKPINLLLRNKRFATPSWRRNDGSALTNRNSSDPLVAVISVFSTSV